MNSLLAALTGFVLGVSAPMACAGVGSPQCNCQLSVAPSFAIYALSMGRGVPEDTYTTYLEIGFFLRELEEQGLVLRLIETRIGIEGERRLCAVFSNSEAAIDACLNICAKLQDLTLINIQIEGCNQ